MKYSKIFLQFVILVMLFSSFSAGCKSRESGQPSNPFAMNRQTAPPPATFSHQAQYLGQTPNIYVPQLPATTYPTGATTYPGTGTPMPNSIPANVPLPSGTGTATTPSGGYGSVNDSNGAATLFQTSAVTSAPAAANTAVASDWTASSTQSTPTLIPTTAQTVFQNLDSKNNSVPMTDVNGVVKTTSYEPETFAISSSQMITNVVSDTFENVPTAVSAQPQSVYAGKYQQ